MIFNQYEKHVIKLAQGGTLVRLTKSYGYEFWVEKNGITTSISYQTQINLRSNFIDLCFNVVTKTTLQMRQYYLLKYEFIENL